jgi:hypothetical protein
MQFIPDSPHELARKRYCSSVAMLRYTRLPRDERSTQGRHISVTITQLPLPELNHYPTYRMQASYTSTGPVGTLCYIGIMAESAKVCTLAYLHLSIVQRIVACKPRTLVLGRWERCATLASWRSLPKYARSLTYIYRLSNASLHASLVR